MKTEGTVSPVQMAHTPLSEGITVIFDQGILSLSPSRSSHRGSSHSSGSSSRRARRREVRRRRHRSSSSTSSSSSSSSSRRHTRSRSHPRCHRASSHSRCCRRHRHGDGRRSPPRHYRAHSRSYSPSPDAASQRGGSRSASPRRGSRGVEGRCGSSRSPPRRHGAYRSRSRTSGRSVTHRSREEKREVARTLKAKATHALRAERLDQPESENPVLERFPTPEPGSEEGVRPEPVPQKSPSQQDAVMEPEDAPSTEMVTMRKSISFTINHAVAKPTSVFIPSTRAESYVAPRTESFTAGRTPYGHWVPVRKVKTSLSHAASKRSLTTSR